MQATKQKFFYGWIIILMGALLYAIPMQLANTFTSYYQPVVCAEFGAIYSQYSLGGTLGSALGMVFGFFVASKIVKKNLRMWMIIGGCIDGVIFFLQGYSTGIWYTVVLTALAGFFTCFFTYIPVNVFINHWFVAKKSTATSICAVGMGAGSMALTPIFSRIIAQDWRLAFRIEGIIILVCVVIFSLFMKTPAQMGASPLMPTEAEAAEAKKKEIVGDTAWPGVTKLQAVKSPAFIFYVIICVVGGILASGILVQFPTYAIENGQDYSLAMVVYSGVHIVGPLLLGVLYDKVGIPLGATISGIITIISLIMWCILPTNTAGVLVAMALFSIGCCICTLTPPLLCTRVFGKKEFGGIYGFGNSFFQIGCILGVSVGAVIRDLTGSYNPAWLTFAALTVVYILAAFAAIKAGKKLAAKYPA